MTGIAVPRQPLLHDLVVTLAAPTVVLSAASGDLDASRPGAGAQGLFHADVRVLSRARLTVAGVEPQPVLGRSDGPGRARFVGLARELGDVVPDPTVRVDRRRALTPGRMHEEITLTSSATAPVRAGLRLELGCDLAALERVKAGGTSGERVARAVPSSGSGSGSGSGSESGVGPGLGWSDDVVAVVVTGAGARLDAAAGTLEWQVELAPGAARTVVWEAVVTDGGSPIAPPKRAPDWARPRVRADDRRLEPLVRQSLWDLQSLRMTASGHPDDVFLAAGTPWYFTLFGRDSIWVARMLLPLGTDLARGTLRVLARRQGRRNDPATEEEPGKILHELRRADLGVRDGAGPVLPPVYYGTVDATPLWVCLLHDAWRWGMAAADVDPLLPALDAALDWVEAAAEAGGGFLAYADHTGSGLANQGWKDSGDAVRFRDGTLAAPPVALAEVQAYAYEAALAGAALLEAFGRPGAERRRAFADGLRTRFRQAFWVQDEHGRYPAMALDGAGRPVDALASNVGHLLGTGLLDDEESARVAARLAGPDLDGGYGLRTMSTTAGGYAPLRYHCGTVWPHDTAIAVRGLVRSGHGGLVGGLVDGLLAAGAAFDWRLPELWGGDGSDQVPVPVPYPAACRPQAWAAAASVAVLTAVLGLEPDVPAGRLTVRPATPSPVGALAVHGLRVGGGELDVEVDAAGAVTLVRAPGLVVQT